MYLATIRIGESKTIIKGDTWEEFVDNIHREIPSKTEGGPDIICWDRYRHTAAGGFCNNPDCDCDGKWEL